MMAVLLTLVALAVRYAVMLKQGTAWFDESFTLHFASMPLREMLGFLAHDVHPPLHAILMNGWLRLLGPDILSARWLSVLLGTAAVPVMMRLAGRYGKSVALVAGGITAFSPIILFHSVDARMYPLLLLLVALATHAFLEMLDGRRKAFIAWGIFSMLALLTHITALLPFGIMLAYGWFFLKDRARFLRVAVVSALPAVAWLGFFTLRRIGLAGGEWQLAMPSRGGSAIIRFLDLFVFASGPWIRALFLPALIIVIAATVLNVRRHKSGAFIIKDASDKTTRFLLLSALLPFLVFLPVHVETTKYLFIAFPALVTLVALGTTRLFGKTGVVKILLVYFLIIASPVALLMTERRIRWEDAMAFIEQEEGEGDIVYASWFASELSIRSYYEGGSEILSAYSYDSSLGFDERLVRHAGQTRITDEVVDDMARSVAHAPNVFLVTGALNLSQQKIPSWFFENGWRLAGMYESNEFSPIVLKLENPGR